MDQVKPSPLSPMAWDDHHVFDVLVTDTVGAHWRAGPFRDYMTERFGLADPATNGWRLETSVPGFGLLAVAGDVFVSFQPLWGDEMRGTYRLEHSARVEAHVAAWKRYLEDRGGYPSGLEDRDEVSVQQAYERLGHIKENFLVSDVLRQVHEATPTPTVDAVHTATVSIARNLAQPLYTGDGPERLALPTGQRFVQLDDLTPILRSPSGVPAAKLHPQP